MVWLPGYLPQHQQRIYTSIPISTIPSQHSPGPVTRPAAPRPFPLPLSLSSALCNRPAVTKHLHTPFLHRRDSNLPQQPKHPLFPSSPSSNSHSPEQAESASARNIPHESCQPSVYRSAGFARENPQINAAIGSRSVRREASGTAAWLLRWSDTWLAAIPSYLAAAHYCSRGWTAVVLLMAPVVLGFIPGPGSSGTTVRFALTPILLWLCSQPGVSPASTIIPPT